MKEQSNYITPNQIDFQRTVDLQFLPFGIVLRTFVQSTIALDRFANPEKTRSMRIGISIVFVGLNDQILSSIETSIFIGEDQRRSIVAQLSSFTTFDIDDRLLTRSRRRARAQKENDKQGEGFELHQIILHRTSRKKTIQRSMLCKCQQRRDDGCALAAKIEECLFKEKID